MELRLLLPRDARFAGTAVSVARHAAHRAGHSKTVADAFARRVEARVRESLGARGPDPILVVVRYDDGPVEMVVNGHKITLES